jgi:hypothetical protein
MRFIPLANARRLKIGQEVFTKDAEGKYGIGKMKKRIETEEGDEIVFTKPTYSDQEASEVSNITHVGFPPTPPKPKEKKKKD